MNQQVMPDIDTLTKTFFQFFCCDRRDQQRQPVAGTRLSLNFKNKEISTHLVENSQSGARLVIKQDLNVDDRVQVKVSSGNSSFYGSARVAWKRKLGSGSCVVGIQYLDADVRKCA